MKTNLLVVTIIKMYTTNIENRPAYVAGCIGNVLSLLVYRYVSERYIAVK
ncbi:hypothetical protein D3OALGA1CA_4894 [Olavius algarvensis associated proteobacterium Delta 3]|nr:hypothetical protein D3OALGA1CA_4894 [Olavius algarvensis associated proteobacterium Delta 3]